nr:hypothetical protein [Gammaproteobacteria bacterium]
MKLPYSEPEPAGSDRARIAKRLRDLMTEVARTHPHALTKSNREEMDFGPTFPANFTKGLKHDNCGLLAFPEDYRCFVEAINSPDSTRFEKDVRTAQTHNTAYACSTKTTCHGREKVTWRGWESPRAGHVYDMQGPDAGAVGMAPAPRVGSSELAAEMAEVYGLALLRDVPFTEICNGGGKRLCASSETPGEAVLSAKEIVVLLNAMAFFSGRQRKSATPHNADANALNEFERNRRFARTQSVDGKLTPETVFRGSTKGAMVGPYISQFMLIGAKSLACAGGG